MSKKTLSHLLPIAEAPGLSPLAARIYKALHSMGIPNEGADAPTSKTLRGIEDCLCLLLEEKVYEAFEFFPGIETIEAQDLLDEDEPDLFTFLLERQEGSDFDGSVAIGYLLLQAATRRAAGASVGPPAPSQIRHYAKEIAQLLKHPEDISTLPSIT